MGRIVFVVLLLEFCVGLYGCPDYWMTFGGNCYQFNQTKVNWFHAQKACTDRNGWLVDIVSEAEDKFIKQTIQTLHHSDDPQNVGYWCSGNDLAVEGQWVWGYPSDAMMTYTDWFPGEPNNIWYDKRSEDCVVLWGHDRHVYQWNDQPCDILDFYICKTEWFSNNWLNMTRRIVITHFSSTI